MGQSTEYLAIFSY